MKFVLILILFMGVQLLTAQNIIKAEYFFDTDPGAGKAILLSFNREEQSVNQTFEEINIAHLSAGFHKLVVRVMDENGIWSLNQSSNFYVNQKPTIPENQITKIAYFTDNDYDNVKYVTIDPENSIENTIQLNVNTLAKGFHSLFVRGQSTNGDWSLIKVVKFYIIENKTTLNIIPTKKIEYYFNKTGIDSATPIEFIVENNIAIAIDSVLLENLNLVQGRYNILARTQDEAGRWSLTNYSAFDLCVPDGVIVGEFDISINGREVTLTNNSLYAEEYSWDMGNDTFINQTEFIKVFNYTYPSGSGDEGYTVIQTVSNFCDSESFSRTIAIETTKIISSIDQLLIYEDSKSNVLVEDLNTVFQPFGQEELTFILIDDPKSSNLEISIEDNQKKVVISPIPNAYGLTNIAIIGAVDSNKDTVIVQASIIIIPVNDPPELSSNFEDISLQEDCCESIIIAENLNFKFTDLDGDTLEYFVSSSNIFSEIIDNKELIISFPENYNGEDIVTIRASDGTLSISDNFKVTVTQVPDFINIIAPISDKEMNEDETLNLGKIQNVFFTPDGDDVSYQFFSPNENIGAILNDNKEMIISPVENYFGEATVKLVATNGSVQAIDEFELTILPVNDPPKLSGLANISFCPSNNGQVFFSSSLNDPDNPNTEISFTAKVLSTSVVEVSINDLNIEIDNHEAIATITSPFNDNVTYKVEFTAIDLGNLFSSDTILISLSGVSFIQEEDNLIATEAESYQWFLNGSPIKDATNQSHLVVRSGLYHVQTTIDDCFSTSRLKDIIISSLEDKLLYNSTLFYPNPAKGIFKIIIDNSKLKGVININIFNATGKHIVSQSFTKKHKIFKRQYQLNSFASGIYFIEISTQNARILTRLIKQ